MGKMRILTFGLENWDSELVSEFCKRDPHEQLSVKFPDEDLHAALARNREPKVDLVVDSRCFPDPDARSLTHHYGRSPEIIRRICDNSNFFRWLVDLKRAFEKARAAAQPAQNGLVEMTIAFYCKKGKHRSVACSYICCEIFRREGWLCGEPKHLSRKGWNKTCAVQNCSNCSNWDAEVKRKFKDVHDMWQRG